MTDIALWLRYGLVWPGMPVTGNPGEADVIVVEALGRNSILDRDLFEVRRIRDERGSDVEAIQRLRELHVDPGLTNCELADEAAAIHRTYQIPMFCQWEIALALRPSWYASNCQNIVCIWPSIEPGVPLQTRDVLFEANRLMADAGYDRMINIAHRRMAVRAYMLARIIMNQAPIILPQRTTTFDRHSVQGHTTGVLPWLSYEPRARCHHLLHRWV